MLQSLDDPVLQSRSPTSDRSFHLMAQSKPCVICTKPVTNQAILTCCRRPCHVSCADYWTDTHFPFLECPICSTRHLLYVIEVIDPQQWKEDPKFVEEVKRLWKENLLWYGICHKRKGPIIGFWGTHINSAIKQPIFLGYTQSEVIPHMKTALIQDMKPKFLWV